VAAVVGEAGVGKSRLVYEFTHSHRLQGWLVLESASVSYGKATSYLPVIDLLKGYFKIQDRDDLREIREKVTGKLPHPGPSPEAERCRRCWRLLDVPGRRRRVADARSAGSVARPRSTPCRRLLLREAREQAAPPDLRGPPLDRRETQALLDGCREPGSARLLLLVNYRPEYQHAWGSKTSYSQLRLDALPAESAGELLEALLGDDPGLAPLKQLLGQAREPVLPGGDRSGRWWRRRALVVERGRYRLTQPIQ
jgi:hypothetical protein